MSEQIRFTNEAKPETKPANALVRASVRVAFVVDMHYTQIVNAVQEMAITVDADRLTESDAQKLEWAAQRIRERIGKVVQR